MLEKINAPEDVKNLNLQEKKQLAEEIRKYILEVVSKNGGHLASNLGVVELTIALHSVFNEPKDKIVWDVGHQTYVHKILTGRREQLKNIRKLGGIAGFPKTKESVYDCFNTGHSSTSISAALGMARARDLKGEDNSVIAVIGDGALTGGMAIEALNDAGFSKCKMTVILNDNEMSISPNIGGLNMFLSKLRTKKLYTTSNISGKKIISKIPIIGKPTVKIVQRLKRSIKQLIIPKMFFEDIGFTYLGPVDGHNIEQLENILKLSKQVDTPVLIHVLTKKGKGYKIAEENPDKFHATGPFDLETGKPKKAKGMDYSKVFGNKLVEMAEKNEKIVITMVGRLSGEKRQDLLFDAIKKSKYEKDIQLVLAGKGPKYKQYIKIGESLTNKPIIEFCDETKLMDLLHKTDLYVHTSDAEIEAISCIEAIACGNVPIISNSNKSATPQFALDERSLFEAGNSDDLARKIDNWLDNKQELDKMRKIYAESADKYRIENSMKKIEEMFEDEIAERSN